MVGYASADGFTIGDVVHKVGSSETVLGVLSVASAFGVIINLWIAIHLLTQYGSLSLAIAPKPATQGLAVGEQMPEFHFADSNGATMRSTDLLQSQKTTHLVFVDAMCRYCSDVYEFLSGDYPKERLDRVVIIGSGAQEMLYQKLGSDLGGRLFFDQDSSARQGMKVDSTPTLVTVDARGVILTGYKVGSAEIRESLLMQSNEDQ